MALDSRTGLILQGRSQGYGLQPCEVTVEAPSMSLGYVPQTTSDRNYKTQTDKNPTRHLPGTHTQTFILAMTIYEAFTRVTAVSHPGMF